MEINETDEIANLIQKAKEKKRGYADHFTWNAERSIEEWGVVTELANSLKVDNKLFFSDIKRRNNQNDPPDCEAINSNGMRIAIEVTELVDKDAIKESKKNPAHKESNWTPNQFLEQLSYLIRRKDESQLKDTPYDGGYIVVVYTDEYKLTRQTVANMLECHKFPALKHITRAFLLLSYDPEIQRYPYFELTLNE